jgi:hydroxymethylbilane synthase
MKKVLKLITRKSKLAMWQAEEVKRRLEAAHPDLEISLVPIVTLGDQWLDSNLADLGGKGLFVSQLESALLAHEADLAVHSLKDVPAILAKGLCLGAFLEGASPYDVLVSATCTHFSALPKGATVGTASLRRQAQLYRLRPDLQIVPMRGNVPTRLKKLDDGLCDALMLAEAGLERLGLLSEHASYRFNLEECLPAIGQGVIAIEVRSEDTELQERIACLNHAPTAQRILAEQTVNVGLGGSCTMPLAIFAQISGETLSLSARVLSKDGKACIEVKELGLSSQAVDLGKQVVASLLAQGALKFLN